MTSQTILDTALAAHAAGISVMPIRPYDPENGDKKPAISWKRLQNERLPKADLATWFTSGAYGLGIVMGEVSGGLLLIELEGRAAHHLPELTTLATDTGLGDLWARMFGWTERSPSGGWHWYVYAPGNTSGNRKLASRPATSQELEDNPHEKMKVLAETRENGGYSVVAPLDGERFHHTGKGAWHVVTGGPTTAGTFTVDELDDLLAVFATLDQTPRIDTPQVATYRSEPALRDPHAGISPGDDYEDKTSWAEILTPHGWTPVFTRGAETFWRRPGKNTGISASTGHADDRDRLYIWTTSTDLPSETPLTKFGAYALLEHNGDYSKAAKHLHGQGYGRQAEHPRDPAGLDTFIANKTSNDKTVVVAEGVLTNEPDNEGDVEPVEAVEPVIYTRTDDGNALRFADTYQGRFLWIPERRTWAVWNGHKWDIDNGDLAAREAAKHVARTLPNIDRADQNHRRKTLSKSGIDNMLTLTQSIPGMYENLPGFDAEPWLLNTPAGIVNLRTGKLTPPTPESRCLRSTSTAPAPDQPTPHWDNFLAETFAGDPTLIRYMQRLLGMATIGRIQEQVLPFFHGTGANGKTTLMNVIQTILGKGDTGYTTTIGADLFLASATNQHPTGLTALMGARIAVASELEEGQRFAESRVKMLTGRDQIAARYMHGNFFVFTPTATVFLLGNHEPEVRAGGSAFWRRMLKTPFLNVVPEDRRDPELETKLEQEAGGILAWILQGTKDYLAGGLAAPAIVKTATEDYEQDQDSVASFLEEMCKIGEPNQQGMSIRVPELRGAYERWCDDAGLEAVSARAFTQRLRAHGVLSDRSMSSRIYRGIRLLHEGDGQTSLAEQIGA